MYLGFNSSLGPSRPCPKIPARRGGGYVFQFLNLLPTCEIFSDVIRFNSTLSDLIKTSHWFNFSGEDVTGSILIITLNVYNVTRRTTCRLFPTSLKTASHGGQ